jgi:hypothetical protein
VLFDLATWPSYTFLDESDRYLDSSQREARTRLQAREIADRMVIRAGVSASLRNRTRSVWCRTPAHGHRSYGPSRNERRRIHGGLAGRSNAHANIRLSPGLQDLEKRHASLESSAPVPAGSQCPGCSGIELLWKLPAATPGHLARSLRITLPDSLCRQADWRKYSCLPRRSHRDRRSLFRQSHQVNLQPRWGPGYRHPLLFPDSIGPLVWERE